MAAELTQFHPSKKYAWFHSRFLDLYYLEHRIRVSSLYEIREWMHAYLMKCPNGWTDETVRTYLNALVQLVREEARFIGKEAVEDKPFLDTIRHERHVLTKRMRSELQENLPRENERVFTWSQIEDLLTNLERETELWAGVLSPPKTPFYYRKWQQRILLSMYVYQECPLRADYHKVWLLGPTDPNPEVDTDNFIRDGVFYLQYDKVVQYKGRASYALDSRNLVLIDRVAAYFGPRKFLITCNHNPNKPIDETGYAATKTNSRSLMSDIHEVDSAKKSHLGVNAIRSAFITAYLADPTHSVADWGRMAAKMRNSVIEWELYYRRIPTSMLVPAPDPIYDPDQAAPDLVSGLETAVQEEKKSPTFNLEPAPEPVPEPEPTSVSLPENRPEDQGPVMLWSPPLTPPPLLSNTNTTFWTECEKCGRFWDGQAQCDCEFRW